MEDKTTKIPSLKEFQRTQQKQDKQSSHKREKAEKKKTTALKQDTHRIEFGVSEKKSVKAKERPTAYSRGASSVKDGSSSRNFASVKKTNSFGAAEPEDRFKAFESDTAYRRRENRGSYESYPLAQKKVAGQRPAVSTSNKRSKESVSSAKRTGSPSRASSQMPRNGKPTDGRKNTSDYRAGGNKGYSLKHAPESPHSRSKRKKTKKPLSPFARKVRRVMAYGAIVLGILAIGVILSMTLLFKTENITVNIPDNFYPTEDIIVASGLHYQESIFMVNKSKAEKTLEEKFPYIKTAEIYAVMPDTINIDITLSSPSYAVKTDKLIYVANEDSKVLEVLSTADEVKVPLIEGVEVTGAKAGEVLSFESSIVSDSLGEMFNLAKDNGYKKITRVDIESETTASGKKTIEIRYVYDDRIVVYLGLPENISYKMKTAQTIISEKLDTNGEVLTGELDVSNAYDTKKSYFNQYSLIPEAVITEPATTATQATESNEFDGTEE